MSRPNHPLGLHNRPKRTPAYVYDIRQIDRDIDEARRATAGPNTRLFYAMKAFAFGELLEEIGERVDGLHASSYFEARLAAEAAHRSNDSPDIHLTTPGLRADEVDELPDLCRYVSLHSTGQLDRFAGRLARIDRSAPARH